MKELPESDLNWKGVRFLDPLGKVFEYEGEFYRAIYPHKIEYVHSLFERGIIDRLVQKGLIVETRMTEFKLNGYGLILWHRRIPFLTRPEEWSRKFLRDAALCGIELNLELLPFGLGTIDFHCANIQQQGRCSPVWIDLGSICPLNSIDQGKGALSELQKYYLRPLYLLSQNKNLNRACRLLLADGGIEEDEFNGLTNSFISTAGQDRRDQLEKIHKWVSTLSFPSLSTEWGNYQPKSNNFDFDSNNADPRSKIVYDIIQNLQPEKVVDLSCNAGNFSLMAGRLGAAVYAVDLDEGAIEKLCDLTKNVEENISITAALRNLAVEQKHIIHGELVLALALSHHIGISQRYPFSIIAKIFSSYSTGALLTEFMPNGLGGTRPVPDPLPPGYSLENFIKAFEPYFRRIETIYYPVPEGWSYRIFILCTERRQVNRQEEGLSEQCTSVYIPHNKTVELSVICRHCGQLFEFTNNIHPICPGCKKDFDFNKFGPGVYRTDKGSTNGSLSRGVLNSKEAALEIGGNNNKLPEILNHKIEISDLLPGPTRPSENVANINSYSHAKVVHLCVQDFGGAGKAAYRLHKGLQQTNVDSTMLVLNKNSGDPSVKILPSTFFGKLQRCLDLSTFISPLWSQQLLRWQNKLAKYPNRPAGLEMFTDALSDIQLEQIQDIKDADIINLHWVAGTLDYPNASLALRDKQIFWTLHDMNPFTGGCHYSGDCEKYKESCGGCPQLGSTIEDDLSRQTWNLKNNAFQNLNLNIVTPSKWLANCASNSSLLSRFPISVIPYGFPLDTFKSFAKNEIRRSLNIPQNANVILFGADSIVNARKGLVYLLEALKRVPTNKECNTVLLTFGNFPEGLQINTDHSIYNLGSITDENKLALAYSAADVFVIPSLEDNLPNTVVEAMACGVPVVGFKIGGIPDMIEHKKNGFLAKPVDIDSLLEGIEWALSASDRGVDISTMCRETSENKFALEIQAEAYKEMYDSLLPSQSLKSEGICTKQLNLETNYQRDPGEDASLTPMSEKDSSKKFLVSAIVSTYNAERFIRGRLEDLENQTIADRLEIVVINSGSQQNEEKIIKEFQDKYSNIKYIKTNQRETVYAAWNRGLKASQGKYITNANTDDRLRNDALEVMVNTLEAHPEIALVYADVIITETENETFERCTQVGNFKWLNFNRDDLLHKGCFVGPQPMWRREVHDEYGYFDASFVTSGDYEFWLRISQSCIFMHLSVELGLYLRSPGSIEHSNRETQREENSKILDIYRKARSCGKIIRRIQGSTSPGDAESRNEDMKSPETIYQNIQKEMGNKQPEEVISEMEMLAASYPGFALAHNDLGVLHYHAGNKEKALQFYEKAVQLDSENMVFQKNLADFYYVELERVEEAARIYVKILEANPEDVETLLISGHICVSLHKFEDAQVFYRRVLELEPLNEAAQENLKKLNQMGSVRPELKSAEDMYQEVQPLLNNGDPHKAIASLEKLLENFPDFALAHNDLGVIHYHVGDKEKAQYHYERAVELMPDNINFQKNLADFYCIELGRIEDGLKIYVRILTADPQDVETLMATGQICRALEKFDDARSFFNQILQIEPWNADARKQIEEMERQPSEGSLDSESAEDAYRRLQKTLNSLTPEDAVVELEKLVGSYPDFAIAHNELAVLYYNTGNKEKSLRHYRQAARLQPENMTLQKNLADFLFVELGKMEDALQIYVDILATHPDDVDTLLISGHICVALKKFDDAKDYYERVLALEPGNQDANNYLQVLINRQNGRSSARPDVLNDVTDSSAKAESIGLNTEESESQDAERHTTVSIIISLDGIQNRLKQCIESIAAHTEEPHEIIFINNEATKGVLKWAQNLAEDNTHYQLIKCDKMHSWAQGLNHAVKAAAGEYIVLMHNDVVVADSWLSRMLPCFRAGSGIGIVGPMTNKTPRIQKAYFSEERDPNRLEFDAKAFYTQNKHRRISATQLASFFLMFRHELIDQIGDFDGQLVSEQAVVADYCKRSAAWGFQNLVAGDVFVYHADRHKGSRKTSDAVQVPAEDQKRLKENWNKIKADRRFLKNTQMMSLLETVNKLHQGGYVDQAVETLLNAIGAAPEETRYYLALAEISISLRRYQDAIDTLNEMPADAKTEMESEETGNFNEPGLQSHPLVISENHEMKTLEILGYAEEGLENFAAAEVYADRMLALSPKSARALNLKGILAYRKEDSNSAEQFFEKSVASDPGAGEPYSNLATVKLAANQEEEAWELFEKAFILNPTDLDIATNYHTLVASRGEHNRAEDIVREAAAIYPDSQKINYMLIDVFLQQGKHEDAMGKIEAAIIKFGIEDGILAAALQVREKLGPMAIQPSKKKAAVSCCMIIKDEEKYLARCLASVKPIADEMIVVDTGSSDRSKDIATAFGAQVYDLDWKKDFAKARNFSLEKASGGWILILDGDEVISSLDYKQFCRIVKNRPKAPVAYTIVTRNYSALANIVGWVPNDGKYVNEEAAAGWIPSIKTRLFYGKDQIWFEGAVHELVDPVVKRKGFETKQCSIPVHHYGRLDKERLKRKGEIYFEIGKKKMDEMGDDISAVREMAIQATTLEENEMAIELWQKLISLDPPELMAADAYINMATLYNRLSNFEQAVSVAKKAVAKAPHIKESLYNYALAELHLGNAQATIKVLEDLVKRMPDYPPAQFILSATYFCVGEKEKGFKIIKELQGTDLGPNLVYPISELAETLLEAQRNEYALLLLGTAIEYDIVNKPILELFKKCIQMRETAKDSPECPPALPLEPESINFENLPQ